MYSCGSIKKEVFLTVVRWQSDCERGLGRWEVVDFEGGRMGHEPRDRGASRRPQRNEFPLALL